LETSEPEGVGGGGTCAMVWYIGRGRKLMADHLQDVHVSVWKSKH
jgi:hypothetical protein